MHDFSSIFSTHLVFKRCSFLSTCPPISVLNPTPAAPFQRELLSMSLYTSLFPEFIPAWPHDTTTSDFHSQLPGSKIFSRSHCLRVEGKRYFIGNRLRRYGRCAIHMYTSSRQIQCYNLKSLWYLAQYLFPFCQIRIWRHILKIYNLFWQSWVAGWRYGIGSITRDVILHPLLD